MSDSTTNSIKLVYSRHLEHWRNMGLCKQRKSICIKNIFSFFIPLMFSNFSTLSANFYLISETTLGYAVAWKSLSKFNRFILIPSLLVKCFLSLCIKLGALEGLARSPALQLRAWYVMVVTIWMPFYIFFWVSMMSLMSIQRFESTGWAMIT